MSVVHADDNSSTDGLPSGEVFEILSSERRRTVIELLASEGPMNRHKLADVVASVETGKDVEDLSDKERKRVQASLKQTHLVKLRDLHVINWSDPEVEPGPYFDTVNWYLANGPGQEKTGLGGVLDRLK